MKYGDRARILSRDYLPGELKSILGQTDLIIGMRMHPLIMGSTMGVPVIGIGISPKFDAFFEMIRQKEFLIDVNELKHESLSKAMLSALANREHKQVGHDERIRLLQARAMENTDYLFQLLNRKRQ